MKSISQFKKLREELSNRRESWFNLDKQAQSLAAQVKTTDKPTKALTAKFNKINLSAEKAKEAFLKKREALLAMTKEIRSSGHDIKSFINSQSKLESSIGRVRSQYNRLGSAIRSHTNS